MKELDSWIPFYYHYGRFPRSANFTNVSRVDMPGFLKTEIPLSPLHLYEKFVATDAKGLVSLHGLSALNIYFGGIQHASQTAFSEFLTNLRYQALSQENDDIFLSFDNAIYLVQSIVNVFINKEKDEIEKTFKISEEIKTKLGTNFDVIEAPAMQIQLGEEEIEIEHESKPVEFSTPLKIEEINEIYDRKKSDFLKIAMKLSQIDLESASEVLDSENEALIQEIINPTPSLVVDDDINVDTQFSFQNSDLDATFTLFNTLKVRLGDILEDTRKKVSSLNFPGEATENIPKDPLYPLSQIKTEDIYIDDSLRDLLYPGEPLYFPQPSTDDRKDFEINVPENEMIVLKSPSLTFASVEKKGLKTMLNKIIEDFDLNLKQTLMSKSNKTETKQKITLLKNINERFATIKKADIEKQLQSQEWLTQLVEDQLKQNKTYFNFGENFENKELKNKFRNVAVKKRKLLPLTLEDRLKDLPSIYTKNPGDALKKLNLLKKYLVI